MSKQIHQGDPLYPERIQIVKQPPKTLYYKGDPSILNTRCVAVVGSRRCTPYGRTIATKIGKRAAELGVTIVSGMAEGIDAAAHIGALEGGGKTIAVLGCGADVCYPPGNKILYKQILQQGLILSEYPDGAGPMRHRFPERNRLISALSESVVIVEAATKRSGSLITAEHAVEQSRELYAVPGNINSTSCYGSNDLLRDGVRPLIQIDDLFIDMGIELRVNKKMISAMGEDEKRIFELISSRSEMTTDELCAASLLPAEKVNGLITVLEMKGAVISSMGKVFVNNV